MNFPTDLSKGSLFSTFNIDAKTEGSLRDILSDKGEVENFTCTLRYGGRQIAALWNIRINRDGDSEVVHFFGSDITERRKLEMQLAQSQRLSALGQMASGIAHDISKPINAVVSLIQVLEDRCEDPDVREKLELMGRQMDYLNNKVRQLVDLGRPMKPDIEAVNINKALMEALRIIRYDITLRDVPIQTYYCPAMRLINLSYDQLLQVFINILLNAGEAVSDREEPAIVISTECGPDSVHIEIQDNGCGIPTENLEHIFDPFFTTRKDRDGSGLGLWMCHHIITGIGGKIWMESVVGQGTAVHLHLPLIREEEHAS